MKFIDGAQNIVVLPFNKGRSHAESAHGFWKEKLNLLEAAPLRSSGGCRTPHVHIRTALPEPKMPHLLSVN